MSSVETLSETDPSRDPRTGRFRKPWKASTVSCQLARNSAGIPGGLGFELPEPVTVLGMTWTPADGDAWASPIGTALAAEIAGMT